MSLTEIVHEIERRATSRDIGQLQEIRRQLKHHSRVAGHSIFTPQTIFEGASNAYAFHYGGRQELQFNVGIEPGGIRHGVAFSFEPSQSLPDPVGVLTTKVRRFNEFLSLYPDRFADMRMWHWCQGDRSSEHLPTQIEADLIRPQAFVFLGRVRAADTIDYDLVMDDFDRLLPLYRFVEGDAAFPEINERRRQGFQFSPGCTVRPARTTASYPERELELAFRHRELQIALYDRLVSTYGADQVATELGNMGGLIDMTVRQGDG